MEIILLEKVGKLGNLGDIVRVKDGYARNFLIPQKMARRATASPPRLSSKHVVQNWKNPQRKNCPQPKHSAKSCPA